MKRFIRYVLPVVVSMLLTWFTPSATPDALPETFGRALVDLLPESTVAAVELRDLDRRWSEIRQLPAVASFQDRVLGELGLDADDLPRLAGNRAVLALVISDNRREVLPIALLRPSQTEEAAALLEARSGVGTEGVGYTLRRGRDTFWLIPAEAEDRLGSLARGRRASRTRDFHLEELERRLPDGGLARGWINPRALRELLLHQVEGTRPAVVAWIEAMGAVEFEAVRFAGFRRDLTPDGVVTDGVVAYDADFLPAEVAHALRSRPAPARLPDALPPGVVAMAAFRPESEASLAWLRHVSMRDPRGSLRNLDFWIDAFEERTGRDVEHDLLDLLGDQGWAVAFEGERSGTLEVAVVCEVDDAEQLEDALLDLRAFLMDHTLGRTLGLVVPRARDARLEGHALHGTTLWSPFGQVEGPVFTLTADHLLLATGDRSAAKALQLIEGKSTWGPVMAEVGLPSPAHEAARIRLSALSPLINELIGLNDDGSDASAWVTAVSDLASNLDTAELGLWYENDALRLRGQLRFASQ
jgi:hypothetical protein